MDCPKQGADVRLRSERSAAGGSLGHGVGWRGQSEKCAGFGF